MKNILKISFIAVLMLVINSCEENEKSPLLLDGPNGAFVQLEIENQVIDVTQIETSTFGGTLIDTGGNVASHEFKVRRFSQGIATDYATVYTTTEFPSDFLVTAGDIGEALGIEIEDILPGDRFDFVGVSVADDGTVVTSNSLNADLLAETGQKQAYLLTTYVSCPFDLDEALGTYTVVESDGFVLNGQTEFEVVDGGEDYSILMINPFGGNEMYDIGIVVDEATGLAEVPEQFAFSTLEQCCAGFEATRIDAEGFVFSCAGVITFTFGTSITQVGTGAQFTFGSGFEFTAQKQ